MARVRLEADEVPGEVLEARMLGTWAGRLKGLLGTGADADPVLLMRCSSVHTFGMGYPLDLAFIGERGEVLEVARSVGPGRVVSCEGAFCVLERPARDGAWPCGGQHLWVRAVSADMRA